MPQLSHLKGRGAGVFIHQLPNRHQLRAAAGLGVGVGLLSLWQFLPATCEQSWLQQLENTLHHPPPTTTTPLPPPPTGLQKLRVPSQSWAPQ